MADLVGYSFRPSESLVSIHPSFLVFLASLWVVLEVNFFVWPKIDLWPHFSGPKNGPKRVKKGPKIPFFQVLFKHRHVTPRWKSFGLRILKKIILGHIDPFGPKNGPKRVKKGPKIPFFKFCTNIGM